MTSCRITDTIGSFGARRRALVAAYGAVLPGLSRLHKRRASAGSLATIVVV